MLGKDPAVTAVVIDFVAPKFWNIGARSLERLDLRSYALEIGVTAGTNTKTQVAEFLSQTHALFEQMLGNVHPTSYAIVHEIPAADWGFGGVSQEHRFIVGRLPS
jgi:4-oxalocrotonate tautomerase